MIDFAALDWIAVAIGTVLGGGLGAFWYSPAAFGNVWMAEIGLDPEQAQPDGAAMGGSILSCAVAATSVEVVTTAIGVASLAGGIAVGALLGLGIVAMAMLSDALFSGWSKRLYFIQMGYRAAYLVIMGAVCGAWNA